MKGKEAWLFQSENPKEIVTIMCVCQVFDVPFLIPVAQKEIILLLIIIIMGKSKGHLML